MHMFVQAKAYTATVPETDARRTRMVPPGLGPRSVFFLRSLRGRCRARSWARGWLRCQLGGRLGCRLRAQLRSRLSALSESARADGQQSSHKKDGSNQGAHGVLSALDASRFSTMTRP